MDGLPMHLLNEILFRVNLRSLAMIQCTNRSLQSHISNDPYFKSEYFSRLGSGLLHISPYGSKLISYHSLGDSKPPRTENVSERCLILGSCSGLLLFSVDGVNGVCVANPITKNTSDLDNRMRKPVYLNGSLHWLRNDGSIVAFNPETEQARLIPTRFPKELSSKTLFAADNKSLALISATEKVIYVYYALESILTDPKWVLGRRIRNGVLDEKRLIRWNVEAYDGMCLVLMETKNDHENSNVRMLHGYDLRANNWGLMGSILVWCDATIDFFQFAPSSSYVIGLREKEGMIWACDHRSICCVRSIMGLVSDGILSENMGKQVWETSVTKR
ncbi:PREDICTED: putative F-box protein At1g57580 [Camelina sativa]|uniref:F-box protein At1g57580 n=1 Tax=Camelina sativa TaxID=90675 RepID=A0ABM1QFI7_CAMSA|nr:PREDICTED: putative F-box protein At1g57580 [Camelina sativa]